MTTIAHSLNEYPRPDCYDLQLQVISDIYNGSISIEQAREIISADDFDDGANRALWERTCSRFDKGGTIDLITLREETGTALFNNIIDKPVSTMHEALSHLGSLATQSKKLKLYSLGMDLVIGASTNSIDADSLDDYKHIFEESINDNRITNCLVLDYSLPCPAPPILMSVCGVGAVYDEGITVIAGKKKSAKSTTVCCICGSFLGGKDVLNFHVCTESVKKVLLFDTEQPTFRIIRQVKRSFHLAGVECQMRDDFIVIPLRSYSPAERLSRTVAMIRSQHPQLVIIDGVADLVKNTNDPEESEKVVSKLLSLTTECHCAMIAVIHTNTNDPTGKQRGHIGSALERKQEASIFLEKDEDTGIFRVSAKDTRDKPFPPFFFSRDENGDPQLESVVDKPVTATDKLLAAMDMGVDYSHSQLIDLLADKGIKEDTASKAIKRNLTRGYIIKTLDGTYHLPVPDG